MNYFKTVICFLLLSNACEVKTDIQTFTRKPENISIIQGEKVRRTILTDEIKQLNVIPTQ